MKITKQKRINMQSNNNNNNNNNNKELKANNANLRLIEWQKNEPNRRMNYLISSNFLKFWENNINKSTVIIKIWSKKNINTSRVLFQFNKNSSYYRK